MIKCPVCGQYEFERENDYDCCPNCWWENDRLQLKKTDKKGANTVTLNQAKENYKVTGKIFNAEDLKKIGELLNL